MPESVPNKEGDPELPEQSSEGSPVVPGRHEEDAAFRAIAEEIVPRLWGTQQDVKRLLEERAFDLRTYELVVEQSLCRELTENDSDAIGSLYESDEIASDTFLNLSEGGISDAITDLEQGGMVDRWNSSERELQELRKVNPEYESSGSEFRRFLRGEHGRAADFRSWGIFDKEGSLMGMVGVFLPPKDPAKHSQHEKEVQEFFTSKDPKMHFQSSLNCANRIPDYIAQAKQTAEFYIIMVRKEMPGAGTVLLEHMFQQLEMEGYDILHWFLQRFGSFSTIVTQPTQKAHNADEGENSASKKYFNDRGFTTCGECDVWTQQEGDTTKKLLQVAAREVRGGSIVIVHPIWKVMRATAADFRHGNFARLQRLHWLANRGRAPQK